MQSCSNPKEIANNKCAEQLRCENEDMLEINSSSVEVLGPEKMAVLSSFVGDYRLAVEYATLNERAIEFPPYFLQSASLPDEFKFFLDSLSQSGNSSAHLFEYFVDNPFDSIGDVFKDYQVESAKDKIIAEADKYHFILINEAHYCGQHRAFTKELLEPLWNKGYRYLALEALKNSVDSELKANPPMNEAGYYIREVNFGLLVREAIHLGFKLIPYEAIDHSEGTDREYEQANNIYKKTLLTDTVGKVLIHAGYSHISEFGDDKFRPMASILKGLAGMDVLTLDQQNMTEMSVPEKMHPFYKYAINHYRFSEPIVFINDSDNTLVDVINCLGIDIQVYHPITTYIHGRPNWMKTPKSRFVPLPSEITNLTGYLVEVRKNGEDCDVVPVDRLIVSNNPDNNYLLLTPGAYTLSIINQKGEGVNSTSITVK
jgi:hypothetical protein